MPAREWYASWFNTSEYLDLYKHRDEKDAQKIIALIFSHIPLKKNAKVLDLACGNGRHSLLFAREGLNVTGIDLSQYLIRLARKRLRKEYSKYKRNLKFAIRDMRNFSFTERFDLAVNIFTSFGYFEKDSDNEKVIKCVSRCLKENGYFVLDFLNKENLKNNLVPYSQAKSQDRILLQVRRIAQNFVSKEIMIVGKEDETYEFKKYKERIKIYSLSNLSTMFNKYKLRIIKKLGNYDGEAFDRNNSPRLILIAQRV
jgi:SAM-dependent methyltransferase